MLFRFAADSLQLDVVTVGKQRAPPVQTPLGIASTIGDEQLPDVSGNACGERNQAIYATFEPVVAQHRHASHLAFGKASRYQHAERTESGDSLTKQDQAGRLIEHLVGAHPQVDADDRFYPGREGCSIELDQGKEIALLGDGASGHPRRSYRFDQRRNAHDTVNQRVLGVQMKMHELSAHGMRPPPGLSELASMAARTGAKLRR